MTLVRIIQWVTVHTERGHLIDLQQVSGHCGVQDSVAADAAASLDHSNHGLHLMLVLSSDMSFAVRTGSLPLSLTPWFNDHAK